MPLPDPARPTSFSALLRNLLIAIAYVALGAFSLAFATAEGYASPIFPAAGLALAVALRFGRSALPGIWTGSASLNLGLSIVSGTLSPTTAAVAACIATGTTIQAWIERFAKAYAHKPEPEGRALVIELDEMWHYLKKSPRSSGSGRLGIVLQADWLTGNAAVAIAPRWNASSPA